MKRRGKIILIVIFGAILLGFFLGLFLNTRLCEAMACHCGTNSKGTGAEGLYELPCNGCTYWNPLFVTFIIDYGKICSSKQIILCEDGLRTGVRYDIDESSCKYHFKFFSGSDFFW